jgi:hypothetical protein
VTAVVASPLLSHGSLPRAAPHPFFFLPLPASPDDFFGRPDMLNNSVTQARVPTKCNSGLLALKVPDPPQFAPSAVCAISADGKIAAVGGRDIELFLWDVDTGDLLSKIRGHDIFWVGSHDNAFFVTCQEDGKVGGGRRSRGWGRHWWLRALGRQRGGIWGRCCLVEDRGGGVH